MYIIELYNLTLSFVCGWNRIREGVVWAIEMMFLFDTISV